MDEAERCKLACEVYATVYENTNSLANDFVGSDLVHLLGAIVTGKDAACQYLEDSKLIGILKEHLPQSAVWEYIAKPGEKKAGIVYCNHTDSIFEETKATQRCKMVTEVFNAVIAEVGPLEGEDVYRMGICAELAKLLAAIVNGEEVDWPDNTLFIRILQKTFPIDNAIWACFKSRKHHHVSRISTLLKATVTEAGLKAEGIVKTGTDSSAARPAESSKAPEPPKVAVDLWEMLQARGKHKKDKFEDE